MMQTTQDLFNRKAAGGGSPFWGFAAAASPGCETHTALPGPNHTAGV